MHIERYILADTTTCQAFFMESSSYPHTLQEIPYGIGRTNNSLDKNPARKVIGKWLCMNTHNVRKGGVSASSISQMADESPLNRAPLKMGGRGYAESLVVRQLMSCLASFTSQAAGSAVQTEPLLQRTPSRKTPTLRKDVEG